MINLYKIVVLFVVATLTGFLSTTRSLAYEEGESGGGTVEGTITFKGTPPPPLLDSFSKHANAAYCSKFDNDGNGNRMVNKVSVNNDRLQDVVVYIQDITKGKRFDFFGTDVKINGCRYLVQGGPSTFVGVVVKGAELRILNEDADPSDPKAANGILMNTHAYEVMGNISNTIFNLPLVEKGQVLKKPVILRKKDTVMMLQGDNHNFMMAWFYPVENPYYAIVGPSGTYEIDRVPPGKYIIIAWHPVLGTQEKEIEVGAAGTVMVNFAFSKQ